MKNLPVILSKAKAGLILDQPFFASILLGLPLIQDDSGQTKTFATDGDSIFFNPAWLEGLSLPETTFVLAHETLHCVFQHMFRREGRNANRWNIATDYVINDVLVKEKIGVMPKGGLLDPQLVIQGKGTAEGVYKLLPDSTEKQGPGDHGGAMDECRDGGKDPAETASKEANMRVKIAQARNAAKMQGKLSAGLDRLVKEMTRVDSNWKEVLRRFFTDRAKVDLSYARPKRRFLADDLYLPSLVGEKLGRVVIAVDCSGSVDDSLLAVFGREANGVKQDAAPSQVDVVYFDSKVLGDVETFGPDDTLTLKPRGGGGTKFSPIFQLLETQDEKPVACIVLTDLQCSDFGPMPSFPVLWASTDRNGRAPFGEVIFIKEGK